MVKSIYFEEKILKSQEQFGLVKSMMQAHSAQRL